MMVDATRSDNIPSLMAKRVNVAEEEPDALVALGDAVFCYHEYRNTTSKIEEILPKHQDSSSQNDASDGTDADEEEDDFEEEDSYDFTQEPFAWENYDDSLHDRWYFYQGLECSKVLKRARPLPTADVWVHLRETYVRVVGINHSSIRPEDVHAKESGYLVPVKSGYSPGKGRGVFAAADIPKGTQIHDETRFLAQFKTGQAYRNFLRELSKELACECMMWTWLDIGADYGFDEEYVLAITMDDSSLLNSANNDSELTVERFAIAAREIGPGEELLETYDDLREVSVEGYESFGL